MIAAPAWTGTCASVSVDQTSTWSSSTTATPDESTTAKPSTLGSVRWPDGLSGELLDRRQIVDRGERANGPTDSHDAVFGDADRNDLPRTANRFQGAGTAS